MLKRSKRVLVPENIREMSPYVAGKTIAEVEKAYQPDQISKLASNENRLGCSPNVTAAVKEAMDEIQDYPDPASGNLRAALAEKLDVSPDNIIVAAGSESVIANLCRTFFLDHEEGITCSATFVGFFVQASVRGIALKKIPPTDEYRFDLQRMADVIDESTKMIYIANPNNPTGTYITKTEFEAFMDRVPEDVLVIMDEAYYEYARDVEDYPDSLNYKFDNVITLRTFSKAYGLAGFRIGYGIAHQDLISHMMKTKLTFEPTTLAQVAAETALKDKDFLARSVQMVAEQKERLYHFFEEHDLQYAPSISNSVMMIMESEEEAIEFTQSMLERGVILRRIHAFGLPNCIRITIGTEREMNHFQQSAKEVLNLQTT
ncbi:MAG: histidinol-phosphate transaminase [Balneolaceae bacterium]|nr:histidinol-phosphate transaminase [Balneolaceae bacterium]